AKGLQRRDSPGHPQATPQQAPRAPGPQQLCGPPVARGARYVSFVAFPLQQEKPWPISSSSSRTPTPTTRTAGAGASVIQLSRATASRLTSSPTATTWRAPSALTLSCARTAYAV